MNNERILYCFIQQQRIIRCICFKNQTKTPKVCTSKPEYKTNPNQQDGRSSPAQGTFHLSSQTPAQKQQTPLRSRKQTQPVNSQH